MFFAGRDLHFDIFDKHKKSLVNTHAVERNMCVIYVLQRNSDDERCLQKGKKQANFELLRLDHLKFRIPTA